MYKMLYVSGRPFSFTDNFNELEKASFDKLLEELSTNMVIDNLLREVKNYNILKIGNDLVFLMDTKESSNKNSSVTSFTKLSSNNLLEAILEAVVNNHGYFETHFQMIKRIKDNELGTENIYRALLVS